MSNSVDEPKLTIDSPVPQETLVKFQQLQGARLQVAERFLDIENEKVRLLRAAANIELERSKLFEGLLVERGLAPNFPVEIDGATGLIKPLENPMEAAIRQAGAPSGPQEVAPPSE